MKFDSISIRPTAEADLDTIIAMERSDDNTPYIRQWPREKHLEAISDTNIGHFVIQASDDDRIVGYIILIGLENPDKRIEFKRIVINEKGNGYGRAAVQFIKRYVFEELGFHRLWLEVLENNQRAYQLYKSEGFVDEGVHRESLKQGERYLSLIVMSMLRHEYENK
ncbi:MAG: GNAT family N-acetyltransferase [Candidatus Zixiibacteriota bacterium]|nr:MAG: GNAT family N-acetyltransferase [candidate division Zixibacteria bacterium]